MELTILETTRESVRAGYACPCGCRPSVKYAQGGGVVQDGCCCGNHFAVGPDASASLLPRDGFRKESEAFAAPWGEGLEAAWLVGPSVHEPAGQGDHEEDDHAHDHEGSGTAAPAGAIDPVCGMTVDPAGARAKGLHSTHGGNEYFFCGKGCKLEFDEDPERFLGPGYVPSM